MEYPRHALQFIKLLSSILFASCGLFLWLFWIRIGGRLSRRADLRFLIHAKKHIIRQRVLVMVPLVQKTEVHFRTLRQPKLFVHLFEICRSIVNREVFSCE